MSLAMILGVCSLVVSTPGVWPAVQAPLIAQVTPAQQNPSSSESQQNPVQPTEQRTDPAQIQSPAPPAVVEKAPAKTTTSPKATPKKHPRRKKPVVAPPATEGPTKVIVKNGGAPDPSVQLSPGVSADQASHQRQSTDLLLSTTESNLKAAEGRQLNANQQDMVNQVHEYIKQAKASADTGDLHRAHNLAFKAKLLSDELAKH
jgi:hypothetical protein